jgi:NAD(P)-dependent dehydrogenase (short-subunit alcohol dehydrogenase family)
MKRLESKAALIIGGTSGIGYAIAERYLEEGASVVITGRTQSKVEDKCTSLRKTGSQVDGIKCDVTSSIDVKRAIDYTIQRFGKLDIALTSAGTTDDSGNAVELSEENWHHVIDVNLTGYFLLAKHVFPVMKEKGGSIINSASQLGLVGARDEVALCASKGGAINLTRALALDGAMHGIRVNCICPAAVETPMLEKWYQSQPDPERFRADWYARHPLGRLGKPEDMAGAAVFFACDDSAWVTGVILPVDGGFTAQ